ncbi:Nuclear transport factor 2 [Cardamine amara subsp. amara]|uniref:Nuclear transport factor 2 n=1 Tax=Cardamine amara subsp. amara TaxID=228776 RepID=A0ABD1B864_CARAN
MFQKRMKLQYESQRVSQPNDGLEDVPKISDASVVTKAIPIGQGQHASSSDHSPEIKTDAVDDNGNNQESQASTECSVFVKRLPPHVTKDMIENAFKKFGRVKRGGIEIRHPDFDYYYAFVEFEEASAAKRAIKASTVWVGGRKVLVKKKLNTVKTYQEQMKINEEEERQYNQNRYGSEQVRGTGAFNFWEWKKKIDERMKTQEQARRLQRQEEEEKSRN